MEYRRPIPIYSTATYNISGRDYILYIFGMQKRTFYHNFIIYTVYEKVSTDYKAYRKDPVPHTGCKGCYRYFRRMRTYQELRYLCDSDHYKYSRKSRNNIPVSWDDIRRSDINHKSWKRYRKYQYKVKGL